MRDGNAEEERADADDRDVEPEVPSGSPEESDGDRDEPRAPLDELASSERHRDDLAVEDPAVEELFDRESIEGIDPDTLWEQVRSDDPPDLEREAGDEREIREVSPSSFCHRCPHFSAPPAVRCEREGTDVLELASRETFRVAGCPRVLEEEALDGRR